MDQNVAHRTPHARHLLDRLGSDLQEQAFFVFFFFRVIVSTGCFSVLRQRGDYREQTSTLGLFLLPLGGLTRREQRLGRSERGRATCACAVGPCRHCLK